ncbi:MAG: AAA family ATPase [Bryobacteraceae bacterium]
MVLRGRQPDIVELTRKLSGAPGAYVLLGAAGCGKTALVSHLADELTADPQTLLLAYSVDAEPDSHFHWRRSLNWTSLGALLDAIEADLEPAAGAISPVPLDQLDQRDRITQRIVSAAGVNRRVVIIVDALEQLLHDGVARRRLLDICRSLPPACHILLTGRSSLVFLYPELWSVAERIPLEGLSFPAFQEVIRDMGVALSSDDSRRLFREFGGMPGSIHALRVAPQPRKLNDFGRTVEETLVRATIRQIKRLTGAEQASVEAALKILAVSREAIGIADLFRLLRKIPLSARPETPETLWTQLAESGILELRASGEENSEDDRKLKLRSEALRDALKRFYFADNLIDVHAILAEQMDRRYPFDRHNKLYHALEAFRDTPKKLAEFTQAIPWLDVLNDALRDDWQKEDNLLLLDFTHLLENLPRQASKTLARRLLKSNLNFTKLETTHRLRLEELLSTARNASSMQTTSSAEPPLRILLDVWPGYFPIFAMQKELHAYGVDFGIVHSSALKYQMLLEGSADLIGSTPGCLSTLPHERLRRYELMGVLNRSDGNDQILADNRALQIVEGKWNGQAQPGKTPRALVVRGSTGHLFLLWYLSRLKIAPSQIEIEYAQEYVGLNKTALDSERFNLISTWEPFASLAMEGRPSLQPVFRSDQQPSVVFDILIARREGAQILSRDPRLQHFWRIYDSCVATKRLADRTTSEELIGKYKLDAEKYHLWIERMHFFNAQERYQFFSGSHQDSLPAVLERIAATWSTAGESVHAADGEWRQDLRQLAASRPHWIFAPFENAHIPSSAKSAEARDNVEQVRQSLGQRVQARITSLYDKRDHEVEHEKMLAPAKKWKKDSDEYRRELRAIHEKWQPLIDAAEAHQRLLQSAQTASDMQPVRNWLEDEITWSGTDSAQGF